MEDWKTLDENKILNYVGAETGVMAHHDRIMNRKMRDVINIASERMIESAEVVGGSVDRAKQIMNDRISEMITSSNNMYRMTKNYSIVMGILTFFIAASAILKGIVLWLSITAPK